MDYSKEKARPSAIAASQRGAGNGQVIAAMLNRVWAEDTEPLALTISGLSSVSPLLLKSGGGALGWSRIRGTDLADTTPGAELHAAYRLHSLQAEINVAKIKKAFGLFANAGLNPVLVKGWSIARHYPELGLRPYGDIDICASQSEFARTSELLKGPSFWSLPIDLHEGFGSLGSDDDEEFLRHSRRIKLDDVEVTVLSPEHHLRALCVHMLRHGAFRPLWLVDIAVAVENRPPDFDWQVCLGTDRRRAGWIECAVGLAQHLLGARIEDTPMAERAGRLPRWLVKQVLKSWSNPESRNHGAERHRAPMKKYLRDPKGLIADLGNRWPDSIEATISVGGPFNRLPRLPFQLANCLLRTGRFVKQFSWPQDGGADRPSQSAFAVERFD